MKYSPLYLAIILLGIVWAFYFRNFTGGFSSSQGDWGTFGDFTGGVINPLLNFITIYLLITQYIQARDDSQQQRKDDSIKAFESSFFTFTSIALNEYKTLKIEHAGRDFIGPAAIGYIQDYIKELSDKNLPIYQGFNDFDQSQHDSIYSLAASFCVVFKLIEDSCPPEAKEKYINLFSMLLPTKVTYLLCACNAITKWKILKHPTNLGYFDKESVKKVLDHYKSLIS